MELLLTSILAFISTNIDDIFLLMLFFGNRNFRPSEIVAGQYAGIISLIAVSIVISLVGLIIGEAYIGILGLVPLYFGVKGLVNLFRHDQENDDPAVVADPTGDKSKILLVAGVTIANGGDNIGIYVPLFGTLAWAEKILMIVVFLAMTAVWCVLAQYLSRHPLLARHIDKYGHMVTPFVLILLGVFIMYTSGTFALVF